MHTILPNVYRACELVGVTQESTCESVGVTQETCDHNYFHTRSVVNKVHPLAQCPQGIMRDSSLLSTYLYMQSSPTFDLQ